MQLNSNISYLTENINNKKHKMNYRSNVREFDWKMDGIKELMSNPYSEPFRIGWWLDVIIELCV